MLVTAHVQPDPMIMNYFSDTPTLVIELRSTYLTQLQRTVHAALYS